VVATDVLKTAGKPAKLVLTADNPGTPITPEWNDVRYVTATLEDADGVRIPDSTTEVRFVVNGPAQVIGVDNGDMMDHEPFLASQRTLYDGNVCAIVRAMGTAGKVTVTAMADGVAAGSVTLTAAPVEREDAVLAKSLAGRSF
jgi:beta-galactosidase